MVDKGALHTTDGSIIGAGESAEANSIELYKKVDVISFVENNCSNIQADAGAVGNQTTIVKRPRGRPRKSVNEEESKRKRAAYQASYRANNREKIAGYRLAAKKLKLNSRSRSSDDTAHVMVGEAAASVNPLQCLGDVAINILAYQVGQDDIFSRGSVDFNNSVDCSEILTGCDIQLTYVLKRPGINDSFKHETITGFVETIYDKENCVDIQPLSDDNEEVAQILKKVPMNLLQDTFVLNNNLTRTGDILHVRAILKQSQVDGFGGRVCATEKYPAVCFGHEIKALEKRSFDELHLGGMILNKAHLTDVMNDMKMCVIAWDRLGVRYVKFEYLMFHRGCRDPVLKSWFIKVDMHTFNGVCHDFPELAKMLLSEMDGRYMKLQRKEDKDFGFVHSLWQSEFVEYLKSEE